MQKKDGSRSKSVRARLLAVASLAIGAALLLPALAAGNAHAANDAGWDRPGMFCSLTSQDMKRSCRFDNTQAYWLATAVCDNEPDGGAQSECMAQARASWLEDNALCAEQYDARQSVCDALGEAPYHPAIDPADFVDTVDNPYFPLVPGTTWVYRKVSAEGVEVTRVTVTHDTREILGVPTTVVRDTVSVDGEVVEDTNDYYAQDREGNVWYFGEISRTYEDGYLTDLEGSWISGTDGAKPGIIMQAHPEIGQVYRQEFALGIGEDMGAVAGLDGSVTVPYGGTYTGVLVTEDWTPMEPDVLEHKYYAAGVGLVAETDEGAMARLVSFSHE